MIQTTPCVRCGKMRVISKTWTEDNTTYTNTVCPDADCQKQVEAELLEKSERMESLKAKALERRQNSISERKKNKVSKLT